MPDLSQKITIYKGQHYSYMITVFDVEGNPEDLTDATLYFSVKKKATDTVYVFEKLSTDVSQLEILPQLVEATKGKAKLKGIPADSSDKAAGEYVFDIWIKSSDGKKYPIVTNQVFEIKTPVRTSII